MDQSGDLDRLVRSQALVSYFFFHTTNMLLLVVWKFFYETSACEHRHFFHTWATLTNKIVRVAHV